MPSKRENVGGAIKWVTSRRNAVDHVTTSAGNVATWAISRCGAIPNGAKSETLVEVRVVGGNSGRKQSRGRKEGDSQGRRDVRRVTEDVTAGSYASEDDFYVFYTGDTDDQNTLKLEIEDKTINVIIDSGASCNLMSEEVFNLVTGGNVKLVECNKRVFEPLRLKGKCNLNVRIPQTQSP